MCINSKIVELNWIALLREPVRFWSPFFFFLIFILVCWIMFILSNIFWSSLFLSRVDIARMKHKAKSGRPLVNLQCSVCSFVAEYFVNSYELNQESRSNRCDQRRRGRRGGCELSPLLFGNIQSCSWSIWQWKGNNPNSRWVIFIIRLKNRFVIL